MMNKNKFNSPRFKPLKALFFVVVFIAIASALTFLVMFLWNNIVTDVTDVKPLSFWKAAGLLLLAKILFGGFGGFKKRMKNGYHNNMRKKWMQMNPEERHEAKMRWKAHCNRRKTKPMEEE